MNKNNPDHFCVKCFRRFGASISSHKLYCDDCYKIRLVGKRRAMYNRRVYRKTLRKFYDFQKIPLILSPYFIESIDTEIIPNIIHQENIEVIALQLVSSKRKYE